MNGGAHLRTAFLITGPQGHGGADDPNDAAVKQRLGALGYKVERRSCGHEDAAREAVEEAEPRRLSLVIISPTAPASAGRAFRNVSIPLVAMNSALYAELGLTGGRDGRDFGVLSSEGHSLHIDLSHPMAAELPRHPAVSKPPFTAGWGQPSRAAHVVASAVNDRVREAAEEAGGGKAAVKATDIKPVIFCYDNGDRMAGPNAPSRRVGILYAKEFAAQAGGGGMGFESFYWRLFDAAVEWAASERPRHFADVFRAEWSEIRTRRLGGRPPEEDPTCHQPLQSPPRNLAGLALSGGGIRAATFCLGLLQEVNARKLLGRFDYLSTVSGGGYIGGWWSAWLSRPAEGQRGGEGLFPPWEMIRPEREGAAAVVETDADGTGDGVGTAEEAALPPVHGAFDEMQVVNSEVADELLAAGRDPVHHLRLFSNYLTPRKGILSPDSWRAATVIIRNMALTWLVLLPVLIAAVLLAKLYFVLQPTSYDPASHYFFFGAGLSTMGALSARLLLTAWPLVVVAGWMVVSVCLWMVTEGGEESRRVWLAGKFGAVVVFILMFVVGYLFYHASGGGRAGIPTLVLASTAAGGVVLCAYWVYPMARRLWGGRDEGAEAGDPQLDKEVRRYGLARLQAKLLVTLAVAAFFLLLAGFGHELVGYVLDPESGPVAKAGGWLAALGAVGGSIYTALKNAPSGGSDERLLDENQSLLNRVIFRVTPTLVILVLAAVVSWAAHLLLVYMHGVYVGGASGVAAVALWAQYGTEARAAVAALLRGVQDMEEATNLIPLLTMTMSLGILLSFYLVLVETRWRDSRPRKLLAWLLLLFAVYLLATLPGIVLTPVLPAACDNLPPISLGFAGCLSTADGPPGEGGWRCFQDTYACLDLRALSAIVFVSYLTGWWLIFRLRAGERRRPRRLAASVLVILVGVTLAGLTVWGLKHVYVSGGIKTPLWLVIFLGGGLLYCLTYTVLETTLGASDNKRSLWLMTSVYLVLNALLGVSALVEYTDVPAPQMTPGQFDIYVTVLLGQGAFGLFGVALTWVVAMGWMADPNRLSMHEFYRARLVRAYLGASNDQRRRRLKTIRETVEGDDVRLRDLGNCRRGAPYHLVNVTLNLVGGRDLTTAQRSADAFVLSKRYCGSSRTGYRDTREYMGGRLSLGTATAVSGAAASPNMGSKTLTASLAMLMTFLNVRLGYWAPTPNKKDWRETKARLWPFYMLREFTSQTNDLSTYCHLTDGGHFDNTGLYALVERGCRLIVVADCGADPKPCFQDMGDALRRCRIDFGAEFDLDLTPLMRSADSGLAPSHFAVGSVVYSREHARSLRWGLRRGEGESEEDWQRRDARARTGVVILVKPAVTGRGETADVRQYKLENSLFPQQTTVDQWFDEAQFESYRRLGRACARGLLDEVKEPGASAPADEWVERFMEAASEKFDPRSPFRASRTPSLGSLLYVI